MRYCPACGSLLDADVDTCPSCGARAATVDARPAPPEEKPQPLKPIEKPKTPWLRFIVPIAAVIVILVAVSFFYAARQRKEESVQQKSRPVLALLRANQMRCLELDGEIRKLATFATQRAELEPIGAYLLDEGSLSLAAIESSLQILSEISGAFEGESAEPIVAMRALLQAHESFCRFLIDQPDGEPYLFADRSNAHLSEIEARKAEAEALVSLLSAEESEHLYAFQDRIAEARDSALTYLLEREKKRSEAEFRQVEAADSKDMQKRIEQIENYELMKAGLETQHQRRRRLIEAHRKNDPLAARPEVDTLSTRTEATPEERILSARTRLWQPRLEEATAEVRALSAKIIGMIGKGSYPPDMIFDCRKLAAAVSYLPIDHIFPTPEPFLERATKKAIDSWRVGAEQCIAENFFALDSNLTTGNESWAQVQTRITELTLID